GFDAVAFLDADNWIAPHHVEALLRLHVRTGAWVCSSARNLVRPDGSLLMRCPEVDGETFVDTNCLLFTRDAFDLAAMWGLMPREMAPICDRFIWRAALQRRYPRADLP